MTATQRHAVVIGAGLAGAATCVALARRGWHCTLVDAAAGPAQAASALPVGMLSPHVTKAPTPLSRLSALGVADTRAELQRLLAQGHGWQACEVDNLGHDPGRWPAALVRPAALVQAWLAEAQQLTGLTTRWNTPVARLQPHTHHGQAGWQALDAHGHLVAQAPVAVVAAAFGSLAVLHHSSSELDSNALPLRPVKGQMSLGALSGPALAARPQRDNGVFVPAYEDSGLAPDWPTRIWSMGSTYVRGDASTTLSNADHERNAHSLQALHPPAAQHLREAAAQGSLLGWANVRCASLDRLPLVGAVPHVAALHQHMAQAGARRGRIALHDTPRWPGLFMLTALGSRGLTLAHWCAQLLAAQMDGAVLDGVEPDLAQALDPGRFAWRLARRQVPAPGALTPAG
ncbi:MAG: FAD-dependent oxidoreductase [Hydrogenophaga sp.]|uniref:FAD-dependent oxidoreductase n=1 Tax=Hydrogenophaga sp. TaxID=1904254 RepID=UPI0027248611|nr:FAD-dependent oxidoreductase [Hydrogenophaga sp.]MDO9480898.1 FAD-dependent oxidoreductase [Hydrogenophaga sp.]MDP3805576.1 FAD-dependent oxidoreductase [Hydrogenophaga sp.]